METKARGVLNLINNRRLSFRRVCLWIFGFMVAVTAIAVRTPAMTSGVRGVLAATVLFGLFTGLLYLVRFVAAHPKTIYPVLFLGALFVTWTVLGSKAPDRTTLRASYMHRLRAFSGVRFVWGGEAAQGMDCSGLARTAFWQAILIDGVRSLNPRLLGPTLWSFWWRDIGANDILDGKYGYTYFLGRAPKLAGYDSSWLQGGDMAVTGNHVLIYDGKGKWIEASPLDRKVVANRPTRNSKRGYFNVPVTFVRWWLLEE